jgi:glycosyltransferase involved in cell wall biosynthesis
MITYNHERYIAQAIESVLEQETPFPVELVVGEDGSTDGTRDILVAYAGRHPGRVRLLLAESNRGMVPNFMATLAACQGRYVALCDGDDYWIDTRKLAKQVAYLEAVPECAVCFHNAFVEYPDGGRTLFHGGLGRRAFSGRDLLERWLIPTSSAVFHNPAFESFPDFYRRATHEDLPLFLLLAERGSLEYLDEVMSVYRRHPGGIMASFTGTSFNQRNIAVLREMDCYFNGKYHALLTRWEAGLHRTNAISHAARGQRWEAARALRTSWSVSRSVTARALWETAQVLLGLASPAVYRQVRSLVRRVR